MKRDPVILDNESGRVLADVPTKSAKPRTLKRPQNSFRRTVEDELSDFAADIVADFVDSVAEGISDAFAVDDVLMRRR